MAITLNTVNIIGNLADDVTDRLRTFEKDGETRHVLTFPLAVDGASNQTEKPGYFDVTCWGKTAENVAKYLGKGSKVAVDGQLRQEMWEKDGEKRYKIGVGNARVIFLNSKNGNGDSQPSAEQIASADTAAAVSSGTDDDIPF